MYVGSNEIITFLDNLFLCSWRPIMPSVYRHRERALNCGMHSLSFVNNWSTRPEAGLQWGGGGGGGRWTGWTGVLRGRWGEGGVRRRAGRTTACSQQGSRGRSRWGGIHCTAFTASTWHRFIEGRWGGEEEEEEEEEALTVQNIRKEHMSENHTDPTLSHSSDTSAQAPVIQNTDHRSALTAWTSSESF